MKELKLLSGSEEYEGGIIFGLTDEHDPTTGMTVEPLGFRKKLTHK